MTLFDRLLEWLLPAACLSCGASLGAGRWPFGLCSPCCGRLERVPAGCWRCGRPLAGAALPHRFECGHCRLRPPAFDRLLAPWAYRPPLDSVLRGLKFSRLDYLADDLGAALLAETRTALGEVDGVVAVPLHGWRLYRRGYNQAELIARELARGLGVPVLRPLRRRRATAPQSRLPRRERQRNVMQAFALRRGWDLRDRCLALVDDVITTGATLDAAAKVLRRAGARRIIAVAVARTPEERR